MKVTVMCVVLVLVMGCASVPEKYPAQAEIVKYQDKEIEQ